MNMICRILIKKYTLCVVKLCFFLVMDWTMHWSYQGIIFLVVILASIDLLFSWIRKCGVPVYQSHFLIFIPSHFTISTKNITILLPTASWHSTFGIRAKFCFGQFLFQFRNHHHLHFPCYHCNSLISFSFWSIRKKIKKKCLQSYIWESFSW